MLTFRHQVTTRLPGAHGIHETPGQIDDHKPNQEVDGSGPARSLPNNSMPTCQPRLFFLSGQILYSLLNAAEFIEKVSRKKSVAPVNSKNIKVSERITPRDPAYRVNSE